MSHTKGPWNVEKVTFRHAVVDNAQNGAWQLVAETASAANAHLIAAAPEMLTALERISDNLHIFILSGELKNSEKVAELNSMILNIVQKAKGEQ